MFYEVFCRSLYKIYSLTKEPYSSITKMTKKASDFSTFMTMIYMELGVLKSSIGNWFISTNKTFVGLFFNHVFILWSSYSISRFYSTISLILFKLCFFGRILSSLCKSSMGAFFTYTKSAITLFGTFVEKIETFSLFTDNTVFKFIYHT